MRTLNEDSYRNQDLSNKYEVIPMTCVKSSIANMFR